MLAWSDFQRGHTTDVMGGGMFDQLPSAGGSSAAGGATGSVTFTAGAVPPAAPADGALWLAAMGDVLRVWANGMWHAVFDDAGLLARNGSRVATGTLDMGANEVTNARLDGGSW